LAAWATALIGPPRGFAKTRVLPRLRTLSIGIAATVIAVITAMLVADASAIAFVKTLPHWIVATAHAITDFGRSGWTLIPAALFIVTAAAICSPVLGRFTQLVLISLVVRAGFIFMAVGLPGLVITIGKRLIGRVRPSDLGPFAYFPWSWRANYAGLPSGHTSAAFGAAVAIAVTWPRARIPMLIYAGVIALTRVILEAHYPSDVLAGAIVGAFGAIIVRNWFAARRLGFTTAADGSVHAMPGPSWRRVKRVARAAFAQ
jgi:undecaprenyl-diphosphatase